MTAINHIFLYFLRYCVCLPSCLNHLSFIATFHNLAFIPQFNLLFISRSLSLYLSQQTFSNPLSCKLGCLSSLISKQVYLPCCSLYLPIQPTLSLNRACSWCVRKKGSSANFRVKCDYLATTFISFLSPFSGATLSLEAFV